MNDEDMMTVADEHSYGEPLSEEEWKKEPMKPKHKAKMPNRIDVTLDMSDEDVLQYDKDGGNLFWDGSLENFKMLDAESIEELSSMNRTRYFSSFQEYQKAFERKDEPKISDRIKISPRLARATQRLEVTGKKPGMHYCWKRSDEVAHSKVEGYKTVSDSTVGSFSGLKDGHHEVGADGDTELVLMEIPEELHQERQRAVSEKSKRRKEAVDNQTREDIRRAGGIPYEAPTGPGGPNFTPSN